MESAEYDLQQQVRHFFCSRGFAALGGRQQVKLKMNEQYDTKSVCGFFCLTLENTEKADFLW